MNSQKIAFFLLAILLLIKVCFCHARAIQGTIAFTTRVACADSTVSQKPEFVGGKTALNIYLAKHIKHTKEFRRANVTGRLIAVFTVNKDGTLSNIKTAESLGFGMDEMFIDVISKMPKWLPGKVAGKPIPMSYTLPFTVCGID